MISSHSFRWTTYKDYKYNFTKLSLDNIRIAHRKQLMLYEQRMKALEMKGFYISCMPDACADIDRVEERLKNTQSNLAVHRIESNHQSHSLGGNNSRFETSDKIRAARALKSSKHFVAYINQRSLTDPLCRFELEYMRSQADTVLVISEELTAQVALVSLFLTDNGTKKVIYETDGDVFAKSSFVKVAKAKIPNLIIQIYKSSS